MTPDEVKAARHALGFTQQALADALGVQRNTIAMWEIWRNPVPRMAEILIGKLLDELDRAAQAERAAAGRRKPRPRE